MGSCERRGSAAGGDQLQEGLLPGPAHGLDPVDGRARGDDAGDEVADVVVGQHGGAHHVVAHLVDHSEGGQEGGDGRGCGDHHLKNAVTVQPGQRALVAQAPGAEDANSVGHLLDL